MTPVLREMIVYGSRWPVDRREREPLAESYFGVLAALVGSALEDELPFYLPTSSDPVVAAAMRYTEQHLAGATLDDVCPAVAVSQRTLRRRFFAATQMTWREYLTRARMLKAMTLLADQDTTITTVATRVGFDSVSAFSRTFTAYAGCSPGTYRRRGLNQP